MMLVRKLRSLSKRRKFVLLVAFPLFGILANIIYANNIREASATDHLEIIYNGTTTPDPIFTSANMLPGDCEIETISIKHLGSETTDVTMKSYGEFNPNNLATQLTMEISNNGSVIYGESGSKTVFDFFNESNSPDGISLATFGGHETKNFTITICFDEDAGNEYQNSLVRFNLKFREKKQDNHGGGNQIDLPDECSNLAGKVTNKIEGTEGNDFIIGTPKGDLIITKGGNDTIFGRSGSDCIISGDNNDFVVTGSGNNVVIAGNGDDTIYGQGGNDTIYSGEGNDNIRGGNGKDIIYAGNGNDTVDGGSRNDILYGEDGNDNLLGRSGNDFLDGGNGQDITNGNSGYDTCVNGETVVQCEL